MTSDSTATSGSRLIFVTGGNRSGKSDYAQALAESLDGPRTYIATCPVIDEEMDKRIEKHRQHRSGKGWDTLEESVALAQALQSVSDSRVVLVDCLTLWINNLLYEAEQNKTDLIEEKIAELCREVAAAARENNRTVIFVSNELGMGLVPADPVSRRYRDLVGRCNQTIAQLADEAIFVVSGLPLKLKEDASL